MASFTDEVIALVNRIPAGQVMSYGDVAEYLGAGVPLAVGQVMRKHGREMPWHRVVYVDGSPQPYEPDEQLRLLAEEGTPIRGRRVDMSAARWDGR